MNDILWTEKSVARNRLTAKYEPLQPFCFKYLIKHLGCRYLFDIGANIGFYSVFIASQLSMQHVYAFEADVHTFSELDANIKLNGMEHKILPINIGISSDNENKIFLIASDLAGINSIASTTFHKKDLFKNSVTIKCITLDNFIKENLQNICRKDRIALKIDVEGHEIEALKGMLHLLENNICLIQVEIYETNISKMHKFLYEINYREILKIDHDYYFTNSTIGIDIKDMFQSSAMELIQTLKAPEKHLSLKRELEIDYNFQGNLCHIRLNNLNASIQTPLYALYVYSGSNKLKVLDYREDSLFQINTDDLPDNTRLSLTGFCRDAFNQRLISRNSVLLNLEHSNSCR